MKQPAKQPPWPALRSRRLIWFVYLGLWSVALLVPIPAGISEGLNVEVGDVDLRFLVAKTLHVTAYAGLAMLSGWLRVPCRYRWLLMLLMAAHAAGTEFIQQFVERGSSVRDVVLDLIGVTLGCLLTWKWWTDPA
jgi:VanZ family protein